MPSSDQPRRSPLAADPVTPASDFVPSDLDAASLDAIRPLYETLRDRDVTDADGLEQWLLDRSELDAATSEALATLFIATTCRTNDEQVQRAYRDYIENVAPELTKLSFELDRRQAELMERFELDRERYEVIERNTKASVEIYRPENVPIQTELSKLDNDYDRVMGAMTIEFEGEERTPQQMARFFEEDDRDLRERAWRAVQDRRLQDRDTLDGIFDRMVELRDQMARNAGFERYTEFNFKKRARFDYGVEESLAFHEAVEKEIVPFARELDRKRREQLGVDALRPWDLKVDPQGRPPLRPFTDGPDLLDRSRRVFRSLDPELADLFEVMGDDMGPCFDLDSRKGKAPGGYQYMRDRQRSPFIFMNAAGLHRDIETMVHEAGHAFHSMLSRDEPLLHYRHAPIEFCEVASMAMELLTMPHWGAYYADEASLARARREQLEGSLSLLPWIATIDAFQHWIYANPKHSRQERVEAWRGLTERFGADISWEGIEDARDYQWHRQGHLFGVPFYYIEYGIAQLGALGLFLHANQHGVESALGHYKRSLAIGGVRPLPELFEAAGIPFDFSAAHIARLRAAVEQELSTIPE